MGAAAISKTDAVNTPPRSSERSERRPRGGRRARRLARKVDSHIPRFVGVDRARAEHPCLRQRRAGPTIHTHGALGGSMRRAERIAPPRPSKRDEA